MLNPTIEPYEIIGIVNYAWERSFANVQTNKKAICERGWFPYNRNLMTYQCLRATMTTVEKENESLDTSRGIIPSHLMHNSTDLVAVPTFDPALAIVPYRSEQQVVNFSSGTAAFCLDKMVSTHDLMTARERIKENRDEGLAMSDKLKKIKTITAGQLFKAKGCRIGKDIFQIHKENMAKDLHEQQTSLRKRKDEYEAHLAASAQLLATGKDINSMTNKELTVLIRPLKRKEDGAMPTRKTDLLAKYIQWKERPLLTFQLETGAEVTDELDTHNEEDNHSLLSEEDAVITAMLQLGQSQNI